MASERPVSTRIPRMLGIGSVIPGGSVVATRRAEAVCSRLPIAVLGGLSHLTGADLQSLDLDDRPKAAALDMKVGRRVIVRIDRDLAGCEPPDRRHDLSPSTRS